MKESFGLKSNNQTLQQFRFQLHQQRKFLKKFYTPFWLQPPTHTGLVASIVLWLVAIVVVVSYKSIFAASIFSFLLFSAAIAVITTCIAYYKFKRRKRRF